MAVFGQSTPNYDESKVPEYTLPEVLKSVDGKMIQKLQDWQLMRRPEVFELFAREMYGKVPNVPYAIDYKTIKEGIPILSGDALLKEVVITIHTAKGSLPFNLMIITPPEKKDSYPCILGLNFYGNHTLLDDKNITITQAWVNNNEGFGITENKANEGTRGVRNYRWDIEIIVGKGYALASIYYGELDPDFDDGFQNGLHPLFFKDGQSKPLPEEWGSIGAWAFGLSRAMDYLEKDPIIDENKVAVIGHSRLGKASLWAGASDERFSLVISNDSGCGGAALSRRTFGETVGRINSSFPHWFNDRFLKYNENESALPLDQHMLLSLVAPRPLYVASAIEDRWADPKGEYLSLYHANPAYKLYGERSISDSEVPKVDQPKVIGKTGYHVRAGGHDVKPYDWAQYLNFADMFFK